MSSLAFDVSIDYPLYQSSRGLYFIGQTPSITGQDRNALALLHNPCNSGYLLFVNAITLTNISDNSLSAEFILKAHIGPGKISPLVSCTNTSICPECTPVGQIEYFDSPVLISNDGVSIFSRIVPPRSTLVVDGGQIILGESQSLCVYIGGFNPVTFDSIHFAFGWSEEKSK